MTNGSEQAPEGLLNRARRKIQLGAQRSTNYARGYAYGESFQDQRPPTATHQPNALESFFDGHQSGPGLWKWRHYFDIYERHFGKFVGRPDTVVVEIGIYSGGSFAMWGEYLGPDASLVGIDIEEECRAYASERLQVVIGDQADPEFWRTFLETVPEFDIVIDDGGHQAHQQIETLEAVLPRLRPGGVYLCEDSEGSEHHFHDYINGLSRQIHAESPRTPPMVHQALPFQRSIDSIHLYPFVTVIEKRESPLEELRCERHGSEWPSF